MVAPCRAVLQGEARSAVEMRLVLCTSITQPKPFAADDDDNASRAHLPTREIKSFLLVSALVRRLAPAAISSHLAVHRAPVPSGSQRRTVGTKTVVRFSA